MDSSFTAPPPPPQDPSWGIFRLKPQQRLRFTPGKVSGKEMIAVVVSVGEDFVELDIQFEPPYAPVRTKTPSHRVLSVWEPI